MVYQRRERHPIMMKWYSLKDSICELMIVESSWYRNATLHVDCVDSSGPNQEIRATNLVAPISYIQRPYL